MMRIESLNVEGVSSNREYAKFRIDASLIYCLQEHWLYNFEKDRMDEFFPDHKNSIRCIDDDEPIEPSHRPIYGQGGVVTLWHKSINHLVQPTDEGNQRILVTLFNFDDCPLCVINCYLPSGSSAKAIELFREDIDGASGCSWSVPSVSVLDSESSESKESSSKD